MSHPKKLRAVLAAAAALAWVVPGGAPLSAAGSASAALGGTGTPARAGADATVAVVVQGHSGRAPDAAAAVLAHGGDVQRTLGVVDGVAARMPRGQLAALAADPRLVAVTPDAALALAGEDAYDGTTDVNSMYNVNQLIGSRQGWKYSTGAGVDVALLDSGVTPVPGLAGAGKVVHGPDLTPESQDPATVHLDTYGHGTHLAGIIAGRDPDADPVSDPGDSRSFMGVAPNARLLSVKVADAHGNTDVSQVLAGIDWVVQHRRDPGLDVRVLNLSFGTDAAQSYVLDPLAHAVEVAWRSGIVVVVSAGNSGATSGRLTNPALSPFVIAVGADDTKNTFNTHDDVIPAFSSRGDGRRDPDLVAPGVHLQSLRVPGSYIDTAYGASGRLGERFFRGGGTSQAAAVVSGVAALLVGQRPTITPDQVKALLRSTASDLPAADRQAQGEGMINWRAGVAARTPDLAAQPWVPSTGTGRLDEARGSARLVLDGVTLSGETDIFGQPYDSAAMASSRARASAWDGGRWNGTEWAAATWSGSTWASVSWTGRTWAGGAWAGRTWAAGTWTGRTWADTNWSGLSWSGAAWAGNSWAGRTWADAAWATAGWE